MTYKLICGNSLLELKKLDSNSIDSVVTDPPYELGFMGKEWDKTGIANNVELWKEVYRVLKPGGHMLAFSGTRTYHRMVCAIEDSGFEIRDQLAWIYGSGFPKSQNVGKMIDKKAGAKRKVVGKSNINIYKDNKNHKFYSDDNGNPEYEKADITEPSTELAKKYDGWGTALKPAQEPIVLARKPLSEKTVAANVVKYGTGAINIDDSRVAYNGETPNVGGRAKHTRGDGYGYKALGENIEANNKGRWPANVIHDGSDEVVQLFPNSKGSGGSVPNVKITGYGDGIGTGKAEYFGGERKKVNSGEGSAARFFYSAKANKQDRNEGCEKLPTTKTNKSIGNRRCLSCGRLELDRITSRCKCDNPDWSNETLAKSIHNNHPTVKPTELMRYLIRLITPKDGIVLDPFNGSGSTGKAAMLEGKNYIGIDLSDDYIKISEARIKSAKKQYDAEADKNKHFETFE